MPTAMAISAIVTPSTAAAMVAPLECCSSVAAGEAVATVPYVAPSDRDGCTAPLEVGAVDGVLSLAVRGGFWSEERSGEDVEVGWVPG